MTVPGTRIKVIAARLFDRETMERVIDPIIADLQAEYGEAFAGGSFVRARWRLVQGYLALGRAVLWLGVRNVLDAGATSVDAQGRLSWMPFLATLAILTAIGMLPPLLMLPTLQHDPGFAALVSIMLIPQALPLSIPASLCVSVLWGTRGRIVTRRRLWTVIVTGFVFSALMWVVIEWIVPDANQAFREMSASRFAVDGGTPSLERGLNELGLSGLGQRTDPHAVRHYHVLWALCFAAIPLSLLACAVAPLVRRAVPAVIVAIVLANAYIAGVVWVDTAPILGGVPPAAVAWIPNTTTLLLASALLLRRPMPRGEAA